MVTMWRLYADYAEKGHFTLFLLNGKCIKGILWQKYKLGLRVVVFIDEIDGETHFAQLGFSWPGEPKMSRK